MANDTTFGEYTFSCESSPRHIIGFKGDFKRIEELIEAKAQERAKERVVQEIQSHRENIRRNKNIIRLMEQKDKKERRAIKEATKRWKDEEKRKRAITEKSRKNSIRLSEEADKKW